MVSAMDAAFMEYQSEKAADYAKMFAERSKVAANKAQRIKDMTPDEMQKAQGANIGVILGCTLVNVCTSEAASAAIQVGGAALFASFSRKDESEADEEAVKNVIRAGIDCDPAKVLLRVPAK